MTYEDKNAVYALNSYLWKLLEANLGWTKYKDAVPIIPTAQQPEFMESGKSFVVYGSSNQATPHLYALRTESIAYAIYSPTSTDANKIVNLLLDAFEIQDEAARNVNIHLETDTKARPVSFGSIRVTGAQHAEPADEEGGYVSSFVMLETKFTVHNPSAQLTGFTYP